MDGGRNIHRRLHSTYSSSFRHTQVRFKHNYFFPINNLMNWHILFILYKLQGLTSIRTQGRDSFVHIQLVTSYRLMYSLDGSIWVNVDDMFGQPAVFHANRDDTVSVFENHLPTGLVARFLRVFPQTYFGYMSMRATVKGCLLDRKRKYLCKWYHNNILY